ncbi:MAG: hypothetical protein RL398_3376 [Planctomycetota bacterium]
MGISAACSRIFELSYYDMVELAALWLPILVSAVFVFLASSVIHMALPIHRGDYRKLPREDAVLDTLRSSVPPGQYMFPCADSMKDMGTPEMQAKFAHGPLGTLIVRPGGSMNMGKSLGQWFVLCLCIGLCVAYAVGLVLPAGDGRVFRIATTIATLAYAFGGVTDSIWKGVRWSTTLKFVFDGVVYGLVTGATFAWLWPTT